MIRSAFIFFTFIFIVSCTSGNNNSPQIQECKTKCETLNAASYSINPHTLSLCQCNFNLKETN